MTILKRMLTLLFLCFIGWSTPEINAYASQAMKEIPTAYKGRFRAFHAYAELCLYELHHSAALKKNVSEALRIFSPEEFIWRLHLEGYSPFVDAPLFYISHSDVKALLGFPVNVDRFSYNQLHRAFFENPSTSLAVMKTLIGTGFNAAYFNPLNRSLTEKIELSTLAPGLWASLKEKDLVVLAAPISPPWNSLTPGNILIADFRRSMFSDQKNETAGLLLELMNQTVRFSKLQGSSLPSERQLEETVDKLTAGKTPPNEIALLINQHFPYTQRLQSAGSMLKVLPSAVTSGEWYSLHALKIKAYHPLKAQLVPVENFTSFSDALFAEIRFAYSNIENNPTPENIDKLALLLEKGYAEFAGKPVKDAEGKTLYYPTRRQLKAEVLYYSFPWIECCIALYGLALLAFILAGNRQTRFLQITALTAIVSAFALHTFILGLRCYILNRPPVSNMFETVIYVPWIAVLTGFILRYAMHSPLPLIGASAVSLLLLIVLKMTDVNSSLENVQAVLDSQFWLIIHVLMIVGSYGVFALSAVLAHIYLCGRKSETMVRCILQGLYIGIALLIPGTILGGVWAAQSWGRFWDWDPKESWAFITGCVYLIVIHAYTFHRIRAFGLAVGAIVGMVAVSFTWYGVNYLLGTGLHSYGFGSGGVKYYFLYLAAESTFLGAVWFLHQKSLAKKQNNTIE